MSAPEAKIEAMAVSSKTGRSVRVTRAPRFARRSPTFISGNVNAGDHLGMFSTRARYIARAAAQLHYGALSSGSYWRGHAVVTMSGSSHFRTSEGICG